MDSLREANPLRRSQVSEEAPVAPRVTTRPTTPTAPTPVTETDRTAPARTTRDSIPQRVITSVTDSIFNFRSSTPRSDTVRRDTLRPVRPTRRQ